MIFYDKLMKFFCLLSFFFIFSNLFPIFISTYHFLAIGHDSLSFEIKKLWAKNVQKTTVFSRFSIFGFFHYHISNQSCKIKISNLVCECLVIRQLITQLME